jgi:CubicO group peptidase (beta-lactamase class C family)
MGKGGFSAGRLGRLPRVLAGHVERGAVPGVVALVSRHGEVHADVVGLGTLEPAVPLRRDTIFRIASMTKPITAAAVMILVEECRLRLDERVDALLPELAHRRVLKRPGGPLDETVPAHRPITVRDLLAFVWGFGLVMEPSGPYPIQKAMDDLRLGQGPPAPLTPPVPDEWMKHLGTLPLLYQPGERWMYNTGSDVLGVLVARASGQRFETFLRERLFDPLGMKDTGFSVPAAKMDRFVTSYWLNPATQLLEVYDEPERGQWNRPPPFPSGAAGLVSTADDYLAFAKMLLDHGRHGRERILSRASVEAMTSDQLTASQKAASGVGFPSFADWGWGFGMSVVTRRSSVGPSVGSYGWDGGLGTAWRSDPREDLIAIVLTPRMWESPTPPAVFPDYFTSVYQAIDD